MNRFYYLYYKIISQLLLFLFVLKLFQLLNMKENKL
jgi:hypothetical protein